MTGPTIRRLLVANRAEIAARVFRTCRTLGVQTVAVHSDADAGLPYVREADAAVRLPGNAPSETYLDVDALLAAARASGADAVHPGYGFLSENAGFARAVLDAGLVWVGPPPDSIEAMGSKVRAKQLMREVGVPVLEAPDQPTEADLPLLVKASAGGGGRGMRIVRALADLPAERAAAEAEAASAFGDGTVFVEPYVEHGRHVEVQVLFDAHGGGAALGDRDCSLQRRHQKVVEEAPAPGLPDEVRAAMHAAALSAGRAAAYVGAGTVEFLYDPRTRRFFFLEMNTRLQVEHPVTEAVHGVDLVALQLAVAEGERLDAGLLDPGLVGAPQGHAIEVRLYAEAVLDDGGAAVYRPQAGMLTRFEIPAEPGVRVDAGYETGSTVSTHYDAMLAKVVVHAPTRRAAARQLAGVLSRARVHGVRTNRDQLVGALRDPDFLAERISTSFLVERTFVPERTFVQPPIAARAAALAIAEHDRATRGVQRGIPVGWRNVVSQPQVCRLGTGEEGVGEEGAGGGAVEVRWWGGRDGYRLEGDVTVVAVSPTAVTLQADGVRTTYEVAITGAITGAAVDVDWPGGHAAYTRLPRFTDPADAVAGGSLLAPMPGTVVAVSVTPGDAVEAGQPVVVLEAMKMQHTVRAPGAGTVTELRVDAGTQVAAGEVLAVVDA